MIVVAGASGRTGKRVASGLLAAGCRVRVLLRRASEREAWLARGAEVEVMSLQDAAALAHAVRDAHALYALVPEDSSAQAFRAERRRIVAALAGLSVEHIVLLSASAAALPDGNGPAAELHVAERALLEAAHKLTVIRSAYFQENLLAMVRNGVMLNFFPERERPVSMVATQDVAQLALGCLLQPPARSEVVDLVGPLYSLRQAAEIIGATLGKALRVVDIPPPEQAALLLRAGLPDELARSLPELYACLDGLVPCGDRMVAGVTTLEETARGGR
jgi:uncharacterized protein YbjT (DUF2867 family)